MNKQLEVQQKELIIEKEDLKTGNKSLTGQNTALKTQVEQLEAHKENRKKVINHHLKELSELLAGLESNLILESDLLNQKKLANHIDMQKKLYDNFMQELENMENNES